MAKRPSKGANGDTRAVKKLKLASEESESENAFDSGDDLLARAMQMQQDDLDDDSDEDSEIGTDLSSEEQDEIMGEAASELEQAIDEEKQADDDGGEWTTVGPSKTPGNVKENKKSLLQRAQSPDVLPVKNVPNMKFLAEAHIDSLRLPSASSSKLKSLNHVLDALRAVITKLPSLEPASVTDAIKRMQKRGVAVPFPTPQPAQDVQWKLAFSAPTRITAVGSWPLSAGSKPSVGSTWTADLAIEMPATLFQEKDVKDFRYHHKRAFYVAAVAAGIKESSLPVDLSFSYLEGDERRPYLQISSRSDGSEHDFSSRNCIIRLIPTFSLTDTPFVLHKLQPNRNNLRTSLLSDNLPPTPDYNASILNDALYTVHQSYLSRTAQTSPSFSDACVLLQAWAKQRNLPDINKLLMFILAYLLNGSNMKRKGVLPVGANAWMLFRGVIEFLARHDFAQTPLVVRGELADASHFDLEAFRPASSAIFVDPTGLVNLVAELSSSSLSLIRFESANTLTALSNDPAEGFKSTFKPVVSLDALQYDASATILVSTSDIAERKELLSLEPMRVDQYLKLIQTTLTQALGTRAKAISLTQSSPARSWSMSSKSSSSAIELQVGLYLDQGEAGRLVDHGPNAEDEEACKAFRSFWGKKSEMRRFKDGRITESVVWDADTPLARSTIVGQIIQYILKEHFKLDEENVKVFVGAFNSFISESLATRKSLYQSDPSVKSFGGIMEAFEGLSGTLRGLDGLPLALKNVSASSEMLRYTSTFVPGSRKTKQYFQLPETTRFIPMADVVLTFETSGHWPDHLEAVQKIKAAFLQRIADLLMEKITYSQCNLAFDLDTSHQSDNVALEILLPSGYAFRARIYHERERTLLSQLPTNTPAEIQHVQEMLKHHTTRFIAKPQHHSAISALQNAFPALGTAIRITKRWFRAHLLSPHITPEMIELFCVAAFLDPTSPLPVPTTAASGFTRTLALLASWSWREEPLLVALYTAVGGDVELGKRRAVFPLDKEARARQTFAQTRKHDPTIVRGGAMYVATEEDLGGKAWGWESPGPMIAARIGAIAEASLSALQSGSSGEVDVETIFCTPLTDFDFVIRLNPTRLTRYHESLSADPAILSLKPAFDKLASVTPTPAILLGYDPASALVGELQKLLGDTTVLFHDLHGGDVIAGLFNPELDKAREWHVGPLTQAVELVAVEGKKKRKVKIDRAGVLKQIKRFAGNYIESVEMQ